MSSLARQRRLLDQVDDLDLVAPGEVLLAQRLEVRERAQRLGRLPGDVQAQVPDLVFAAARRRRRVSAVTAPASRRRRGSQCASTASAPAEPALLGALAGAVLDAGRAVAQQALDDVGFVLELAPQRRGLRLDRLAPALQVDPALLEVLQARRAVGALLRLLRLARGAGEHALRADVDVGQLDALAR